MNKYLKLSDDLEKERIEYNKKIRKAVHEFINIPKNQRGGYCIKTVRHTLKSLGFSTIGLQNLKGQDSNNVNDIVNNLILLEETGENVEFVMKSPGKSLHHTAQERTNAFINDIMLVLLYNYKYPDRKEGRGGCHHIAMMLKQKITPWFIYPLIIQGGLFPDEMKYMESFQYGFSLNWKNTKGVYNRDVITYVRYGIKK
jgi:hypothetical protein